MADATCASQSGVGPRARHKRFSLMTTWIDSHCHLDAPEFAADRAAVRARAAARGVGHCVVPAVEVANFDTVRQLAHLGGDSYALGIHPLFVGRAQDSDLALLDAQLQAHGGDPRLVAVGEIGLDYFVPELCESPLRERQEFFYREQLRLARKHRLPVILHVRRSADRLLHGLRAMQGAGGLCGGRHRAAAGGGCPRQPGLADGLL